MSPRITEEIYRFRNALAELGIETERMEVVLPARDAATLSAAIEKEAGHLVSAVAEVPCDRPANVVAEVMGVTFVAKTEE